MLEVTPSQAKEILRFAIQVNEPIIFVGKPGIAKTAICEQVAEEEGLHLIKIHPALDDLGDAKGLPWFADGDGSARFVPIGQMAKVLSATEPTLLLLDDFLQAMEAVQKTYMQILHGREFGGHRIPDCVRIVLATNDRTHRAGAGGALEPIKSRTGIFHVVEDLDDWATWFFGQTEIDGVPITPDLIAETVAFLKTRPELFCKFDPNTDLKNSPNPRTWTKSTKWLTRDQMPKELQMASQTAAVGEEAAVERMGFRDLYKQVPTIDAILLDPESVEVPTKPSILFAVLGALAGRANKKNFARVARFGERVMEAGRGDMATLLIRNATRMKPELQQTPAFVKLMAGELGQLVAGTAV